MAAILASILQSINKSTQEPLNILTINNKESYQSELAKTKNNFYFLHPPNTNTWNEKIRSIPDNCFMLNGEDLESQFTQDVKFDLILCQNRMLHYGLLIQVARQMSCPIISLEYSLSNPALDPSVVESMAFQNYNRYIFISEFTAYSWGFDPDDDEVSIINPPIDTKLFDEWKGNDNRVLSLVRNYKERSDIMGFNIFQEIGKQFPTKKVDAEILDIKELIENYQKAPVFINTSQWHPCPLALLEAMSVGCPVVTSDTTSLSEIIIDGENGFVTNNVDEMKSRIGELMSNKELANKIGQAARKTIQENFNAEKCVNQFNSVLHECSGLTSAALKE